MTEPIVLDASAVLAFLQGETGQDLVEAALEQGVCRLTAVNLCEVLGKLHGRGMPIEEAAAAVHELQLMVVDFGGELASIAASLRVRTKSIGASLGDCACLALAERAAREGTRPVVYTAERAWARLDLPFEIRTIR